jgi:predicted CoA-binding protein
MPSKRSIDSLLSCRRIAVVGASRDPKDFSRALFRAFVERGYDVVPVNAPAAPGPVVRECADAGVKRVWLHRGAGQGAVSPEAVALCRERGLEVVDGECPFMFLPDAGFVHRVHRFFRRLGGRLPG